MKRDSHAHQLSPSQGGRRSPGKNERAQGGLIDHSFRPGTTEHSKAESNYESRRSKQHDSRDFSEKRGSPGRHSRRLEESLGSDDKNVYRREIDDLRSSIEKLRNKEERQRMAHPREYEIALDEWEKSQAKKKQAEREMELTYSNVQSPVRPITQIGGPHLDTVEKEIIRKQQQKREEEMLRYLSKRAEEKEQEHALHATKSLPKSGSAKKNLKTSFHALEEKIHDLEKELDTHSRTRDVGGEVQASTRGFSKGKVNNQGQGTRDFEELRATTSSQAKKKAASTKKSTISSTGRLKATSAEEAFELEMERLREENRLIKKELEELKNQKQRGRFVPMNDDEYDIYMPDQEIHEERQQTLKAHFTNKVVNNETLDQRLERAEKKYVSDPAISQVIKKTREKVQTGLHKNTKKAQQKPWIATYKVREKENYLKPTGVQTQKNIGPKKYHPEKTFLIHLGIPSTKRSENLQY